MISRLRNVVNVREWPVRLFSTNEYDDGDDDEDAYGSSPCTGSPNHISTPTQQLVNNYVIRQRPTFVPGACPTDSRSFPWAISEYIRNRDCVIFTSLVIQSSSWCGLGQTDRAEGTDEGRNIRHDRTDERSNGQTDERTDGQIYGRTDERTNGHEHCTRCATDTSSRMRSSNMSLRAEPRDWLMYIASVG